MDKKTNKLKLFIENFLVYGLGGVISKIIPLIMVPIITRLMPDTTYYGVSDLTNTIVSFAGAFAILGMYDGMYRMFFEKDVMGYKKSVCSTTLIFTLLSTTVTCVVMFLFRNVLAERVLKNTDYTYLVYIAIVSTLVSATNNIISAPTRMQNKRKVFLITNTLSSVLSYAISIPLILQGYYIIALPIAALISSLTLEIAFFVMNKSWFSFSLFDKRILKETLKIAIPLFPNFLIYWVFNSCDRVMISNYMSVADVGIYSVGGKLGHMSQLIYNAFAGGWLFFSFSTMKEKNQVKNNSRIFEYMGAIAFVATAFIFSISYPFFNVLFTGDYVLGYQIAPYLFLAPLLQMLFQIACNQFVVIKKTWPNMFLLALGAVANVVLNSILIPQIGIEGASLATLAGYVITVVITVIVLQKMRLMDVSWRFVMLTAIFSCYVLGWRFGFRENSIIGFTVFIIFGVLVFVLYREDIVELMDGLKDIKGKKA